MTVGKQSEYKETIWRLLLTLMQEIITAWTEVEVMQMEKNGWTLQNLGSGRM